MGLDDIPETRCHSYALLLITWTSLRLKSPAPRISVQLYVQAKMQCKFSTLPAFYVGKPPVAPGWPRQIASNSGNVPLSRRQHVCECIGFVAIATDMCEKGVPPSTHRIWWAEEPQPMFTWRTDTQHTYRTNIFRGITSVHIIIHIIIIKNQLYWSTSLCIFEHDKWQL